jgi:anti-sigma factor ChrR (cupin superfamily)
VRHERGDTEARERAALYALGALDSETAREFEAHLADGCPMCAADHEAFAAVARDFALDAEPVAPPQDLRERVLARARTAGRVEQPGFHFLRAHEGRWVEIARGVEQRILAGRPGSPPATYLIRLAPGVTVDTHVHGAVEHCYVLEGDVHIAGRRLEAGDYHEAATASVHEGLRTAGGCLLLIVEAAA